jgi:hypothetical protein
MNEMSLQEVLAYISTLEPKPGNEFELVVVEGRAYYSCKLCNMQV